MTFNKRYGKTWWRTTSNLPLQRTLKYAEPEQFKIYILEHSLDTPEQLNAREIFYAETLNTYCPHGYNVRECGQEARMRCPEGTEKMRKGREKTRKTYRVRNILTKQEVDITYVKGWCEEHHIAEQSFRHMLSGHCMASQGYCLVTTDPSRFRPDGTWIFEKKQHAVKHIESGQVLTFGNPRWFAEERGLKIRGLLCMLNGQSAASQGYCLPDTELEPLQTYQVTDPNGKVFQFHSLDAFEEDHGISLAAMRKGAKKNRAGWSNLVVSQEGRKCCWPGSRARSTSDPSPHPI